MTSAIALDYEQWLARKTLTAPAVGFAISPDAVSPTLKDFQRDCVVRAVRIGRGAIFAAVGLGKTLMYGEWMRLINRVTLITIPLGIARQSVRKLKEHLGIEARYVRSMAEVKPDECQFYLVNYEMVHHFDPAAFGAVVVDESSLFKNYSGKIKTYMDQAFANTPYKLCLTATPAPNDLLELGNHAQFLGVMSSRQMISVFFIQDDRRNGEFRLKRHAIRQFYQWVTSWAIALRRPSDLGYSDEGYRLPAIRHHLHTVVANYTPEGILPGFGSGRIGTIDAKAIRKLSITPRAELAASIINASDEQWVVWCDLNDEAAALNKLVEGSVNIHGSLKLHEKEAGIEDFCDNKIRVLITKPKIAGLGVDMQQCHNTMFLGLGHSWEQYHQAVGRTARFGQAADEVQVHVVTSEEELPVYESTIAKGHEANAMIDAMIEIQRETMLINTAPETRQYEEADYASDNDRWTLLLGDCVRRMRQLAAHSVDMVFFSPPFADLFVFSKMAEDLSNSMSHDEFMQHMAFVADELLRITKPGRICAFHIMDRKLTYVRDGKRGVFPLSDELIRAYTAAGWTLRARVTIDKSPELVVHRTKDPDLTYGSLKRSGLDVAPMVPDYLLVFQAPGEPEVDTDPVGRGEIDFPTWCLWARAVWYGVKETDVLPTASATGNDDERHVAPTQLEVALRAFTLWSNPGELVFSPFAGVASEGVVAVKNGRRFLGIELKKEYALRACKNLQAAEVYSKGKLL